MITGAGHNADAGQVHAAGIVVKDIPVKKMIMLLRLFPMMPGYDPGQFYGREPQSVVAMASQPEMIEPDAIMIDGLADSGKEELALGTFARAREIR